MMNGTLLEFINILSDDVSIVTNRLRTWEAFEDYRHLIVDKLITITGLCQCIPKPYHKYTKLVYDGAYFLLMGISKDRLIDLIAHQLSIETNTTDVSTPERLIGLATKIPVLYKLGQIIARNPDVEQSFRHWLIKLENGIITTNILYFKRFVESALKDNIDKYAICIDNHILSEASVAVVASFKWQDAAKESNGVFKIIKPDICAYLNEELALLDGLALYYSKNRETYGLLNFNFIDTLKDVSTLLKNEVSLIKEQNNLYEAAYFYKKDDGLKVPALFSFSNENVTAMEKIEGTKITEAQLTRQERIDCCKAITRAIICYTLFCETTMCLFHGDPHAGNIFVVQGDDKAVKVVFLDWALTGKLSRQERHAILWTAIGVFLDNKNIAFNALLRLAKNNFVFKDFEHTFMQAFDNYDCNARRSLIEKTLNLVDTVVKSGITFPDNLLLFRKSVFTVKGVIHHLEPQFNMDEYFLEYMKELLISELPTRVKSSFMPFIDNYANYTSLLTNYDLFYLGNFIAFNNIYNFLHAEQ
ncbi:MAG: AarF/UbiB family protein [Candidatus Magnetoovum sp. WYHC-5]|nr:AarF/UbiB family protein [Candidatus Magnetoovum sp. WYHC-5]